MELSLDGTSVTTAIITVGTEHMTEVKVRALTTQQVLDLR